MERIIGGKFMKIKTFTKILSGILCAALTMQIGWSVTKKQAHADEPGSIAVNGNSVTLNATSTYDHVPFNISALEGGGYKISSMDVSEVVDEIDTLTVNHRRINLSFDTDVTIGTLWLYDLNALSIPSGKTITIGTIGTLNGNTVISGTLSTDKFDTTNRGTNFIGLQIRYGATIIANSIDVSGANNTTYENANYYPKNTFIKGSNNLAGTVYAQPDTRISSTGGSFTLKVGNATKTITTSCSNKRAADLFDDPFSFGTVPDVLYGKDYDFSSLITKANGYNGTITLEYSNDNSNFNTTKPTAVGNYYVRATATDSGSFLGKTTSSQSYSIDFATPDELGLSAPYVSVSGVVNGKYIPGALTLTAPEGFLLGSTTIPDVDGFSDSLSLTARQITNDVGVINEDLGIIFKSNEGAMKDAMTDDITLATAYPGIENYIFDLEDPYIDVKTVDDREMSIEDGKLTGDKVVIGIGDVNLDKIYINGELYNYAGNEDGYVELELNSTVGKTTDYKIKATDLAGKSTTLEFTLFPNTTDALISVKAPEGTIYSGDDYDIDVKTNSDGTVTLQYKDADTGTVLSSKPTAAGNYTVTATSAKTTFYFEAKDSADFTIVKRTPDTTVTVPGIVYVGNDYDVVSDTDSDGTVTYQYYDEENDSYLSSKPTTAGEYSVTVRTYETFKYYSSDDTATFKLIKNDPTVTLSVPDTTIGQTYSPEFVTNSDSDSITFEYKVKGAADSTYTKTKPSAAGTYTIRVTIGSTEKFNEASATDDFTINKKTPSVSLGVGTPYAGTTYKPSFTSNSDAADKAVFEYKEKNADDSKFSTTLPTAYGEYVVRVTIPETAEFVKTTVTANFKIIYLDAPQTAYVLEGQPGKNNYFVSDVVLKAPTGYTISAVYGGTYTASIPYKDGITSVYLKRTSDGALTNGIPIKNAPRVDKSAPSISTPSGNIAPGTVMYVSDFTLTVADPNLRSLKVNGEAIDLTNYKDGYTLTLSPGLGSETYKVMAEDEAGNVTTLEFTLKAEWLQDKVIIPDVVLPLEGNESYNLGEGYWLVTRNTPDGPVTDDTVYSGNMPFYVNEGGDYTFTKVTQ